MKKKKTLRVNHRSILVKKTFKSTSRVIDPPLMLLGQDPNLVVAILEAERGIISSEEKVRCVILPSIVVQSL
jgi:hypothetical protein